MPLEYFVYFLLLFETPFVRYDVKLSQHKYLFSMGGISYIRTHMLMLTANPMGPARGPHLFPSSKVRSRKGAIKMTTTAVVPIHAGLSKKIFFSL